MLTVRIWSILVFLTIGLSIVIGAVFGYLTDSKSLALAFGSVLLGVAALLSINIIYTRGVVPAVVWVKEWIVDVGRGVEKFFERERGDDAERGIELAFCGVTSSAPTGTNPIHPVAV